MQCTRSLNKRLKKRYGLAKYQFTADAVFNNFANNKIKTKYTCPNFQIIILSGN